MSKETAQPLKGIKVLDFGHTIMGPCAGLILADLGADVIKIEPFEGDPTRRLSGFAEGFFATFNRNKRSIALDLKKPEGQSALLRLARGADIVLENFGPGTIERLGGGCEALRAENPRLIFLAMKGFLKGPSDQRGALDEVVQMESGIAYMTGPPGRPLRAGASIIDILGAVFGVTAVLAALHERTTTGMGKRIGASLYESAAFLMAPHIAGGVVSGEPMVPFPARKNAFGVYDVFGTRDGRQAFVGITSDFQWQRFCDSFGRADLAGDERLQTNVARCAARDWLIPDLTEMFAGLLLEDLLERCNDARVPASRVGHPDDLVHDPQLRAGGLMEVALGAFGGGQEVEIPGLPLEFGDERERTVLRSQPPAVSEHGRAILLEADFTDAEVDTLIAHGVVRAPSPFRSRQSQLMAGSMPAAPPTK